MKKLITVLTFAAATFVSVSTASAQTVVQYNSAADITNNFRQTRSNANVLAFNSGNGSNGSTPGFANFGGAADNNTVRYAYDTDPTAGVTTFTTGLVALDIRLAAENQSFGLWFGGGTAVSPADTLV